MRVRQFRSSLFVEPRASSQRLRVAALAHHSSSAANCLDTVLPRGRPTSAGCRANRGCANDNSRILRSRVVESAAFPIPLQSPSTRSAAVNIRLANMAAKTWRILQFIANTSISASVGPITFRITFTRPISSASAFDSICPCASRQRMLRLVPRCAPGFECRRNSAHFDRELTSLSCSPS